GSAAARGRINAFGSYSAVQERDGAKALEEAQAAASADPANPEYHLNLADLRGRAGDTRGQEAELRRATEVAPIGKVFYRYGKFLLAQSRPKEAAAMFERAERLDPHYLQNLLALADAYKADAR